MTNMGPQTLPGPQTKDAEGNRCRDCESWQRRRGGDGKCKNSRNARPQILPPNSDIWQVCWIHSHESQWCDRFVQRNMKK